MDVTEDKVVARIRKMLALSRSSNEHEAANAAAAAQRLMAEHQIEEAQLRLNDDASPAEPITEEIIDDRGRGRRSHWRFDVASAVASSLGAKTWWRGPSVCILARPSVARTCAYLFQYLTREIDRLADEREGDRAWKNAFRLGAAYTIARRLAEQRRSQERERAEAAEAGAADAPSRAMVLLRREDQEVAEKYASMSKGWRTIGGPRISDIDGYLQGRAAGNDVSLGGSSKSIGASPARIRGAA